eukprot:6357947-Amphidinium_carterae.2
MTDDEDIVSCVCTMLDQLFERLHSPVIFHFGRVRYYACNTIKLGRFEILSVPHWRPAYIRLMKALYNLMHALKASDNGRIHLFGIPFDGPVTCWARWASKVFVLVDGVTHRIILLFRLAPLGLVSSSRPAQCSNLALVSGGMPATRPAKRPYPFGPFQQDTQTSVPNVGDSDIVNDNQQVQSRNITLIFHGSFAPFHHGHISCIRDATHLVERYGHRVVKCIVACTTDHQLRKKVDASSVFEVLQPAETRIRIMQALVKDEKLSNVEVATRSFKSGDAVSYEFFDQCDSMHIHVVGEDVQGKLTPRTIIVSRSGDKTQNVIARFDQFSMAGICVQSKAIGSSSTMVRAHLLQGSIPIEYVASSLALFRELFPVAKFRSQPEEEVAQIEASSSASCLVRAKAMPKRKTPDSAAACAAIDMPDIDASNNRILVDDRRSQTSSSEAQTSCPHT